MRSSPLLALAASLSFTSAVLQGFNYGSTHTDGTYKNQADFEAEFKTAQNLVGTSGFTSARLYTMIQGGTANTPISAIPAAIAQKTTLLLGLWASAGQDVINNEIAALKSAISTYGTSFTSLVAGISVGSEDLYRISPTGIAAKSGYGANPDTIVNYINQVRSALQGTTLSGAKIGHVDTWTAWVNGSNSAVINAADWLGMDAYPYFQNTMSNSIDSGASLFFNAYDATAAVSGGKDVWITETGWPVSGATENLAVPSTQNAKTYWDQVGCQRAFGKINTYWYTLRDAYPTTPNPSFGIVGSTLSTTPLFDLSCSGVSSSSSSSLSPSASSAPTPATKVSSPASGSAPPTLAATGGSGLTPSQGGGNGVIYSSPVTVATIPSNGTYIITTMTTPATSTGTNKASGTSTGPVTVGTSGAIAGSVSLTAGALAAVFAIMVTM